MQPNLLIGMITLIGKELNVDWLDPHNRYTSTCWLSNTHNTIDLVEKTFLQANREHKQEQGEGNTKLQVWIKYMGLKKGSILDSKGLIDTGEQGQ